MATTERRTQFPLELNHAMIYSRDVSQALGFYRDLLGLAVLEEVRAGDRVVYARLKLPSGPSTIALHLLPPKEALNTAEFACTSKSAILTDSVTRSKAKVLSSLSHPQ